MPPLDVRNTSSPTRETPRSLQSIAETVSACASGISSISASMSLSEAGRASSSAVASLPGSASNLDSSSDSASAASDSDFRPVASLHSSEACTLRSPERCCAADKGDALVVFNVIHSLAQGLPRFSAHLDTSWQTYRLSQSAFCELQHYLRENQINYFFDDKVRYDLRPKSCCFILRMPRREHAMFSASVIFAIDRALERLRTDLIDIRNAAKEDEESDNGAVDRDNGIDVIGVVDQYDEVAARRRFSHHLAQIIPAGSSDVKLDQSTVSPDHVWLFLGHSKPTLLMEIASSQSSKNLFRVAPNHITSSLLNTILVLGFNLSCPVPIALSDASAASHAREASDAVLMFRGSITNGVGSCDPNPPCQVFRRNGRVVDATRWSTSTSLICSPSLCTGACLVSFTIMSASLKPPRSQ